MVLRGLGRLARPKPSASGPAPVFLETGEGNECRTRSRTFFRAVRCCPAAGTGSSDTILERYHHPPGEISVPSATSALVIIHMRGPLSVEEKSEHSGWVRRWTDRGQASVTPAGGPVARRFAGRPEILLVQVAPHLIDQVIVESVDVEPKGITLTPSFARPDPNAGQLLPPVGGGGRPSLRPRVIDWRRTCWAGRSP